VNKENPDQTIDFEAAISKDKSLLRVAHLIKTIGVSEEEKKPKLQEHIWTNAGDLEKKEYLVNPLRGSFQPAIDGIRFKEYLQSIDSGTGKSVLFDIPREHVTKATLISILFGTIDLNAANLFYTPSTEDKPGRFIFYDNTRSMPNSNGVIRIADGMYPAYKSNLLELRQSYENLTSTELQEIKNQIAEFKEKAVKIEKYLTHPRIVKQLNLLPPGWLDVKESIQAMHERLNNVETAINDNKVECLRDLVFAASPEIKFIMALSILIEPSEEEDEDEKQFIPPLLAIVEDPGPVDLFFIQKIPFVDFVKPLELLFKKCKGYGLDASKVDEWCRDSSLTFEEVIQKMCHYVQETMAKAGSETEEEKKAREERTDALLSKLNAKAKLDLKDMPREDSIKFVEELKESKEPKESYEKEK
jgi:hypothetical protein